MNRPIASLSNYERLVISKALDTIKIRAENSSKAWESNNDILMHIQLDVIEAEIRKLREVLFL